MAPILHPGHVARQHLPDGASIADRLALLLNSPALPPDQIPPGADTTMTLDGPDQIWYLVVAILCIAIPGLFLLIRVYTKIAIVRSFEAADYFLFLSFPLIIVEIVMGYYMVKWGAGVHQWQITLDQLQRQFYWTNLAQVIYCPLSFVVKMAILLQYLRLFAPSRSVNRIMWHGSWFTIASCFIFYTVFMFWTLFYCNPREAIWNKLIPDAKCHDVNHIIISQGAFNMGSDIIILLLPSASLWQLNVPLKKKILVTLLFATGLLACAASAMRIVFTLKIAPVFTMTDVSHNGLFIGLWTEAEVALGFIVACSLCLPKLIQAKGNKIKRAMSKASSPWSSFGGTVRSLSRRSTFRTVSRKSTQVSRTSIQMHNAEPSRPLTYEEREQQQRNQVERHTPDAYAIPATTGSSEYSQSAESKRTSEEDIGNTRLTTLHVQHNSSSDPFPSMRSPTNRMTREQMSPEQLREEIYVLQQFNFDTIRQSMEEAHRGRPMSHLPNP